MNSLIHNRAITPEDILREREARAKVLYSPCQDCDIKWRYCSCFVCRAVWDPTGEQDARLANLHLRNQEEEEPEKDNSIPTSLPLPKDIQKTITLSGSEINLALRLITEFEKHLDESIAKLTSAHEDHILTSGTFPPAPPELDELFATKTTVMNVIQDLERKLSS
jgi:hypothetical protein